MYGYADNKEELLGRLRKVEGQIRGLQRLIDDDAYCIDIVTQVAAANSALRKVAVALLEDHIRHCIAEGRQTSGRTREDKVLDASAAIERLMRA